jgi:hypothetical protein
MYPLISNLKVIPSDVATTPYIEEYLHTLLHSILNKSNVESISPLLASALDAVIRQACLR